MHRSAILIAIEILWAGTAVAQSPADINTQAQASAQNQQASDSLPAGAPIEAALAKSVDSKKLKPGDSVVAQATESTEQNGKTLIPRGTRIEGHVTQASSRGKGDSFSTVGVVFDKAILKDGQQIPLTVTVQAIALSQNAATAPSPEAGMSPMGSSGSSAPGVPGRIGGGAPAATTPVEQNPINTAGNLDANNAAAGKGAVGGMNSSGVLTANSRGVFGLPGIGLTMGTEGAQHSAVITSTGKNVHLDSGTQVLLVTQGPATPKS
jgi:hypothetical protein